MDYANGYTNGWLQRADSGRHEGMITIDGVNLSPIEGSYFKENEKTYLWIKRKPMLVYDEKQMCYNQKAREPRWECYLEKVVGSDVDFKGSFYFLHFKYKITGIWDKVIGKDMQRLNLFVERLPMNEQNIINNINERKRKENGFNE